MKLYQLCTSNGILLDFIVYNGNIAPQLLEMEEGALITERIPTTLMERYFGKGHNLYIDNFYASLRLTNTSLRMAQMSQELLGKTENSSHLN